MSKDTDEARKQRREGVTSKLAAALMLVVLTLGASLTVYGQGANGTIEGTVTDESGAVIPNAAVVITNKATGALRNVTSNTQGFYTAPTLLAGDYEVRVGVQGFRTVVRDATVLAGTVTTINLTMPLGGTQEIVNVEASASLMSYDSNTVQGSIE